MPKKLIIKKVFSVICILMCIPLVVFLSLKLDSSQQYITSIIILGLSLIALFLSYEKRKPQAKEIIVLAVLCTIAIVGRQIFAFLPHVKPVGAIVLLVGVTMGANSGFICGAVTMLASNFFFGQGPWTPWQMLGFGLLGFVAGKVFYNRSKINNVIFYIIFYVIFYMLVVGPLLDFSYVFSFGNMVDFSSIFKILLAGVPINLIQTVSSSVFILILYKPFIYQMDRMKTQHGLMENK